MTDLVSQLVGALEGMLALDEENHQRYPGDEDVCKEVQAAQAALTAAKAGGWLPIETAPKDGTAVLVSEGRFCSCVEWNEEFDWWAVDDNKLGPFRLRGAAPTHWQPLPNPPKEQSAGGPGSVDAVANPLSPT